MQAVRAARRHAARRVARVTSGGGLRCNAPTRGRHAGVEAPERDVGIGKGGRVRRGVAGARV